MSRANKSIAASLITTGYAIPIAILNPYLAGGIFLDYLVRGRFPRIHEHPTKLDPEELSALGKLSLKEAPASEAGDELQPGEDGAEPADPASEQPSVGSVVGSAMMNMPGVQP
jgi:hypothetical protein